MVTPTQYHSRFLLAVLLVAYVSLAPAQGPFWDAFTSATELFKARRFDEAAQGLERAIGLSKSCKEASRAQLVLGQCYAELGRREEAKAAFREVFSCSRPVGSVVAEAHYRLGLLLAADGDLSQASTHYEQVLEIEDAVDVHDQLSRLRLGELLIDAWKLEDARSILAPVAEAGRPENKAVALFNLGMLEDKAGDHWASLEYLRKGLAIEEATPLLKGWLHFHHARVAERLGELEEALESAEAAMQAPQLAQHVQHAARDLVASIRAESKESPSLPREAGSGSQTLDWLDRARGWTVAQQEDRAILCLFSMPGNAQSERLLALLEDRGSSHGAFRDYVLVRVDVDTSEGLALAREFNVFRAPSFLVLAPDGSEQLRVTFHERDTWQTLLRRLEH